MDEGQKGQVRTPHVQGMCLLFIRLNRSKQLTHVQSLVEQGNSLVNDSVCAWKSIGVQLYLYECDLA